MPTGKRLRAIAKLAPGAVLADLIAAFNALLDALREAGWMDHD